MDKDILQKYYDFVKNHISKRDFDDLHRCYVLEISTLSRLYVKDRWFTDKPDLVQKQLINQIGRVLYIVFQIKIKFAYQDQDDYRVNRIIDSRSNIFHCKDNHLNLCDLLAIADEFLRYRLSDNPQFYFEVDTNYLIVSLADFAENIGSSLKAVINKNIENSTKKHG